MVPLRACEVRQLLHNKFVVILGDSVQRAVYKDLVLLLQKDSLLTPSQLKAKGELSFEQDKLLQGGQLDTLHNGITYREVRQFLSGHHLVRFYFLTRVYSEYLEAVLEQLCTGEHAPDLVIMNSCLWDLSRYGPESGQSYLENLAKLFAHLGQVLPASCLLIWNTAMPVGQKITARFLPPEGQLDAASLRARLVEANFYCFAEARKHGFDLLDLHFHFRHAGQHRHHDGVHWDARAHRCLSHLLLEHVADAWGVELPHRAPASRTRSAGATKMSTCPGDEALPPIAQAPTGPPTGVRMPSLSGFLLSVLETVFSLCLVENISLFLAAGSHLKCKLWLCPRRACITHTRRASGSAPTVPVSRG